MSSLEVRRALAYTPEQLFDLAADVERYPEFLPWWHAVRVSGRTGEAYLTDQVVGIGPLRERFRSRTTLERPRRIEVTSSGGAFRAFDLTWRFEPLPDGACEVVLALEIEPRAALMRRLFRRVLGRLLEPIMSAFEARARRLYGAPAQPRSAAPGARVSHG